MAIFARKKSWVFDFLKKNKNLYVIDVNLIPGYMRYPGIFLWGDTYPNALYEKYYVTFDIRFMLHGIN